MHGLPGRREHLWTRRVTDNVFSISCIPFFTYGIALGDKVQVSDGGVIQRVIEKQGHKTLRVASDKREEEAVHVLIHDWVAKTGLPYEFFNPGYLAVDVPPGRDKDVDTAALEELNEAGRIQMEWDE
jgi:hypothetical protein